MPAGTRQSLHSRSAVRLLSVRWRSSSRAPLLALNAAFEPSRSSAPGTCRSARTARRRAPLVAVPKKQMLRRLLCMLTASSSGKLGT